MCGGLLGLGGVGGELCEMVGVWVLNVGVAPGESPALAPRPVARPRTPGVDDVTGGGSRVGTLPWLGTGGAVQSDEARSCNNLIASDVD